MIDCDCNKNTCPGVLWPWAPDGDDSLPYVERCDDCERFDTDADAAQALADKIGSRVLYGNLHDAQMDENDNPIEPNLHPFVPKPEIMKAIEESVIQ